MGGPRREFESGGHIMNGDDIVKVINIAALCLMAFMGFII